MYTAKIQRKEQTQRGLDIYVDFYKDGVKSHTENTIPQDADGFRYWLKSRLTTLNSGLVLQTTLVDGDEVDVSDPVVTPVELTPAEIARNTWLTKYRAWVKIKSTIVDTGIVPIGNAQITARLDDLKATLLPDYINYI